MAYGGSARGSCCEYIRITRIIVHNKCIYYCTSFCMMPRCVIRQRMIE